jgi:hypothetical protein
MATLAEYVNSGRLPSVAPPVHVAAMTTDGTTVEEVPWAHR